MPAGAGSKRLGAAFPPVALPGVALLVVALLAGACSDAGPRSAGDPSAAPGPAGADQPCPVGAVCAEDPLAELSSLLREGDVTGADLLLLTRIEAARAAGDTRREAEALGRRAALLSRRDGLAAALDVLQEILPLLPPDDHLRGAEVACLEGSFRAAASDPSGFEAARRGLDLLDVDPLDPELLSRPEEVLPVLARCLFAAGQNRAQEARVHGYEALDYLEAAARVQARLGDGPGRAASLQWAGNTRTSLADYATGLRQLEEAYDVAMAAGVPGTAAWALHGRARTLSDLGKPREAALEAARSREMMEKAGDRVGLAWSHRLAMDLALADGDPEGARAHLASFLRIRATLGPEVPPLERAPAELRIARVEGDPAGILAAVEAFDVASDGGRLRPSSTLPRLAMAGALLQVGEVDRAARLLREVSEPEGSAWITLWTWHARLAEIAALEGALEEAEAELETALGWLARLRAHVYTRDLRYGVQALASTDLTDPDLGVATVLAGLAAGGRIERAFALASELRARDLERERLRTVALAPVPILVSLPAFAEGAGVGGGPDVVARLREALAPDEALVLYVTGRGGEPTTRFFLHRDRLEARLLPPVDSIEPLVERMLGGLASGDPAEGLRARVGAMLLPGLAEEAKAGLSRLVVVPDQGLHRVPFDALLLPEPAGPVAGPGGERLMLETYVVTQVPSPELLLSLRMAAPLTGVAARDAAGSPLPDRGVLALGYGRSGRTQGGDLLPRLRWAEQEARRVARLLPGSRVRTGNQATPEALLEGTRSGYQILHVAGHARVDADLPGRTALYLAPSRGGGRAAAGHPSPGQDGVLTMAWVEGHPLPFPLVVLSACGTGDGAETRGEGLAGPARSFLAAGARAVVGSGWDVEDRATLFQMEAFYRELARGHDAGTALALMKREAYRRGRPPGEWAAFQLHGDASVRVTERQAPAMRPQERVRSWGTAARSGLAWFSPGTTTRPEGTREEGASTEKPADAPPGEAPRHARGGDRPPAAGASRGEG